LKIVFPRYLENVISINYLKFIYEEVFLSFSIKKTCEEEKYKYGRNIERNEIIDIHLSLKLEILKARETLYSILVG